MVKRLIPRTVKTRFMGLIVVTLAIIICASITLNYTRSKESLIERERSLNRQHHTQVIDLFQSKADQARIIATIFAKDQAIAWCVDTKNTQRLKDLTYEKFLVFKTEFNMSQLHFHVPPATSLFRAHQPEKFGDDLTSIRQGIVDCNKTKKRIEGLEKGRFGFGIRGIIPIFMGEKHVGSVGAGMSVNDLLLNELKEKSGFNISIVVPDKKEGFKFLAKTHDLPLARSSHPLLAQVMKDGRIKQKIVSKDGKTFITLFAPLKDYSGKNVGVIGIPRDITADLKEFNKDSMKIGLFGLCFLVILLVLFNFIYDLSINRPLKNITDKINMITSGDFTVRIHEKMPHPKESPSTDPENKRCWETLGTFSAVDISCPKLVDKTFKSCEECTDVFKNFKMGEFQLLSSYFNALAYSLCKLVNDIKQNSSLILEASEDLSHAAVETQKGVQESSENAVLVSKEAQSVSSGMDSVAAASEQTSTNINSVAEEARSMGQNITDIARKTDDASQISRDAVERTKQASAKVSELSASALDINKVTEVITEISEQTNLLALNATIEAARAGEAGKGFAVVAGEIKELARQTFAATAEIKQSITTIQNSTNDTSKGIIEISGVINKVDEIVTSITHAMEEQSSSTESIITNMDEAAKGLGEVNETIASSSLSTAKIAEDVEKISKISQELAGRAQKISKKSGDLNDMSEKANSMVEKFKV